VINIPAARFTEFIDFFPPLELPISLLPDISLISTVTVPLPGALIDAFIMPFEGDEVDEYTEYIPYGKISGTKNFHALIYWKAAVMQYEFILAIYSNEGDLLAHAIIGGLRSDNEGILHSVSVIHEDLTITIAEGFTSAEGDLQDNPNTYTYQMAIKPDGSISYEINEEDKKE